VNASHWERRRGVDVLVWSVLEGTADAVVTTRHGGVSVGPYASLNLGLHVGDDPAKVLENRRRAARVVGAQLGDLVVANQVHGNRVVVVAEADRGAGATTQPQGTVADADAMVTGDPGLVLVVLAADCVPIVLCDPRRHLLGVAHAGWRGTVANVASATVATMVASGSDPLDLVVGIGPAVSPHGYQVGPDVAGPLCEVLDDADAALIRPDGPERWLVDLAGANHHLLTRAGVPGAQIHHAPVCTGAAGPFFSDRAVRPCGRFGLLARLAAKTL
jgi:polyphenol oxidase